jgi:hypothetical protein
MMTRIAIGALCVAWALIGCGGSVDDEALITETDDQPDEALEIEKSILDASDYGWMALGVGIGNVECTMTSNSGTSGNCYIPTDKTVKYKVTGTGMSATQKADIEALVDGSILRLAGDYSGWTISRVTSGTADVNISFGSNPGTNKNSIHSYVYGTPSSLVVQDDLGRTGTYSKFGSLACDISHTNIVRDFNSSQQPKVRAHAVDVCFGLGVGTGTGGSVTRPHAVAVTPAALKQDAPSDRNKCLALNYNATGNGLLVNSDFNGLSVCAGQNDL